MKNDRNTCTAILHAPFKGDVTARRLTFALASHLRSNFDSAILLKLGTEFVWQIAATDKLPTTALQSMG